MPESTKNTPIVQGKKRSAPAGKDIPKAAASAPPDYPPRPAPPKQRPVRPQAPEKKTTPASTGAPADARPASTVPPAPSHTPSEDVLELEDIVSNLQSKDAVPVAEEGPLFEFDIAPGSKEPDLPLSPLAPPSKKTPGSEIGQAPKAPRPVERIEYRTSSVRRRGFPADGEPFFTNTTLWQAGIGALVLMLVFLAGVFVGSTPSTPKPEPAPKAPTLQLQPQVEFLSNAAVRDLGPQPADFGPALMAKAMIQFIVELAGRDVYVLKFSRGGESSIFTVNFPKETITHKEGVKGAGLILTWKGFILERLRAAAQGKTFEMTPEGRSPATLARF